jgi:2-haloacid dehalogenase
MLQSAMVSVITDAYSDFGTIGRAALRMVAALQGVELSEERVQFVVSGIREVPPHPEVPAALRRLADAGFRLAALTNSTREVAGAQLEHAGLSRLFEQILSADSVRRLKPAREPYLKAAEMLQVAPRDVLLVAAHSWDVAGAMRAGCSAAFVARPGMVLDPLAPKPQVVGDDLAVVVDAITNG